MLAFLESLLEESTWVRVGMVILGSVLVIMALWNIGPVNNMFAALRNNYPG